MWPVLLEWAGSKIYAYPLFMGLAWGIGFRLCEARLPNNIKSREFILWFAGLFLSSWVGAKILFLITQDQWQSTELLSAANFWLGGGFVFLGGLVAGVLYTWLWGQFIPRMNAMRMNFCLIPLLWAHAIGRLGCLLAGCCFGTVTELPWAIHLHGDLRHPVQIYEALGLALLALALQHRESKNGKILADYLLGYGVLRWGLEWFRGDDVRGIWLGMSSSQWISIILVICGLSVILRTYLPLSRQSDK